jgi:hypothetical protein
VAVVVVQEIQVQTLLEVMEALVVVVLMFLTTPDLLVNLAGLEILQAHPHHKEIMAVMVLAALQT